MDADHLIAAHRCVEVLMNMRIRTRDILSGGYYVLLVCGALRCYLILLFIKII